MTTQQIAESILGVIDWKSSDEGYCLCPGENFHTKANGKRDCKVMLAGNKPPTITCFHSSCSELIAEYNYKFRSELGKAEARQNGQHGKRKSGAMNHHSTKKNPSAVKLDAVPRYKIEGEIKLPEPMTDGTRALLRTVFQPGEGVRIAHARLDDDGHEVPADSGACLSREEWLRKLDAKNGNPNGIFHSTSKTGIYITVNPMKVGGSKDSEVTSYRHALIEFDNISPEEQWNLYAQSRIPCAAIISSGGKSIHAWAKVDARDRKEYDERVVQLYQHFEAAGYSVDSKNKNPSRFSRLPNCVRFSRRQELLALNTGAESFSQWLSEIQMEGIGETFSSQRLRNWKPEGDENSLIGKRWINKGGSCVLSAPSGVGKSSLEMQLAVGWAIGRPVYGISPARALKSLIVQAENDEGDLAESHQGAIAYFGIDEFNNEKEFDYLDKNFAVETLTTHVGDDCIQALRRLCDKHRPDIIWIDPAAAFVGDDISRQTTIASFFRKGLNSISKSTGVAWFIINHTTKPPTDSKAKSHWQASDFQYSGAGSYDLPGWARAVCVLRQVDDLNFELKLAKRGKRAGATHPSGEPTTSIWLQHAPDKIAWLQVEKPAESEKPQRAPKEKKEKESVVGKVIAKGIESFLKGVAGEHKEGLSQRGIAKLIHEWTESSGMDVAEISCRSIIVKSLVEEHKLLRKKDDKYYVI